jgi:hypothetical protein
VIGDQPGDRGIERTPRPLADDAGGERDAAERALEIRVPRDVSDADGRGLALPFRPSAR